MGSRWGTKRAWLPVAAAGAALLGIGFFGGVTLAARGPSPSGMSTGAGMQGMMSGQGMTGGEDMSKMTAAMEGIMAEMHPDLPPEQRARLIEKCREAMTAMSGRHDRHHGRSGTQENVSP